MTPEQLFEQGAHAGSVCRNSAEFQIAKEAALKAYEAGLVAFAANQLGCVCGFADWIMFDDDSVRCSHCQEPKAPDTTPELK
jgi:hypothetical protein